MAATIRMACTIWSDPVLKESSDLSFTISGISRNGKTDHKDDHDQNGFIQQNTPIHYSVMLLISLDRQFVWFHQVSVFIGG